MLADIDLSYMLLDLSGLSAADVERLRRLAYRKIYKLAVPTSAGLKSL